VNAVVVQILPTAQRLLDELLSSQQTTINTVCGAPGMTSYDLTCMISPVCCCLWGRFDWL